MKLNEIKRVPPTDNRGFLTDEKDIRKWLIKNKNTSLDFYGEYVCKIDEHGIVDSSELVFVSTAPSNKISKLPVRFGTVRSFDAGSNSLTTFEGVPTEVKGVCIVSNNKVTSIEFLPRKAAQIFMQLNQITSLIGISDIVEECEKLCCSFDMSTGANIEEGGLGLILIKGLTKIEGFNKNAKSSPWVIINKYLGRPDDIFDCQNELIEAGFDKFAQL